MNDSPHRQAIAPLEQLLPRRTPRIGDNFKQLEYETNDALRELEADSKQRAPMANIGFRAVKRKLRGF